MEDKKIELRSDDVQEILGTPPSWLVSWGTMVLIGVIATMVMAAWFIQYPDVINAKVVLTTAIPPVEVVARTEGHIAKLMVSDNDNVVHGKVLVVLQSTARFEDVMRLDDLVNALQKAGIDTFRTVRPLTGLELGELQTDYSFFVQNLENLQFSKTEKNASVTSNVSSIEQQISRLESSIKYDRTSKSRALVQLTNAKDMYVRQQKLYTDGAISLVELERERLKLGEAEQLVESFEEGIIRKQNDIINLRKSIGDINFTVKEDASTSTGRLRESLNALRSSLDKWKQTYLLTAPIDGKASLNTAFFSEQQFVKQGDQVMTIVPPESDSIIGRVMLPVAGSGKVKIGQRVILRLDSYPYYEFGTVEGQVKSRSLAPKDNMYAIQISLTKGLKTSYNRDLQFEQQLQGDAQIITENKRFLERIWDQIFAKATAYR